jgi:hypothetical protein
MAKNKSLMLTSVILFVPLLIYPFATLLQLSTNELGIRTTGLLLNTLVMS